MKQIMMVGAGSVGGFLGRIWPKTIPNVSFLLRPRTLEAVKRHGLMIKSAKGNFTVHPPAASDPRQLAAPDLIILGVKAYDLDEVMAQLEPVMTEAHRDSYPSERHRYGRSDHCKGAPRLCGRRRGVHLFQNH